MLEWLQHVIAESLAEHDANAETDVFTVTSDVGMTAYGHHVTPAKYLAILELQAVDPTATFEGFTAHSIGEIRERTRSHGSNHHNDEDDSHIIDTEHNLPVIDDHETEENHDQTNGNGHHGAGNGHH